MRFWTLALSLALFVATSTSWLHAQFQEPRKEELQMTEDPKAPGAAAVYLNLADVTDNTMHYRSFYARIKVLQEKGKELATVTVPAHLHEAFKVTDIKGRTIHADGTVIPLTGKPEDLLMLKTSGTQIDQMTFTLPSVEVGSILEYRYEIRYENYLSTPFWQLQKDYLVHNAHYVFIPQGYRLEKWEQLPVGVHVITNPAVGEYTLDVKDIPPVPHEAWMPPIDSQTYQVLFFYKSQFGDYWESEAKQWAKQVDHFAEPTKLIHEAVDGITSSHDSDLDKARKLYNAVQSLDNTNFSRQKGKLELKRLGLREAKRAEDTWTQKSGSRQDISLLYLAMLRAAGLTAWEMKVVDRQRAVFAPGYLNFDQLDDDIVILETGGKEVMLDPGEKMCPFQTVSWRHSGADGVRESAVGNSVAKSPFQAYTSNEVKRIGTVFLDEHGGMTGSFRFVMTGQVALYWRQQAILNDEDEVKKLFDRSLLTIMPEGVDGHLDHFINLNNPDVNLIAIVNAKGTLGTTTSRRILLPAFFFEVRGHRPFIDQSQRQTPVDMRYAEQIIDQVIYQLPAGFSIEGAPHDTSISWADQADLRTKVVQDAGEVTVARSLVRAFTLLKPELYGDLHAFYQKVDAGDQQQLVLVTNPEHKEN